MLDNTNVKLEPIRFEVFMSFWKITFAVASLVLATFSLQAGRSEASDGFVGALYECREGAEFPVTTAVFDNGETQDIFGWTKVQHFTARERCERVSDNLQRNSESMNYLRLDFIKSKIGTLEPVVCATKSARESCNHQNLIITLKNGEDVKMVTKTLRDNFKYKKGILMRSGNAYLINMRTLRASKAR